jgi:hypothetical protein
VTNARLRTIVDHRRTISLALSAATGAAGLWFWPFPATNLWLAMIGEHSPRVYHGLAYTYATLWFSTSFLMFSAVFASLFIFVAQLRPGSAKIALPPYPDPSTRTDLFLVLGEQHHRRTPTRSASPTWLTIPERGLYTGIAIVGAIGSGKTSACVYPYLEQLLAYQTGDPARRLAALILEVKGDFSEHVRQILQRHNRAADYVEISLDATYRYNPLHNDLDAYALAYSIATVITNLHGRGKEPFWQQASTNLVKFVILLHQVLDDYVTLFQVYEHVINPDKLRARIAAGERRFGAGTRRLVIEKDAHRQTDQLMAWEWHDDESGMKTWSYWSADLEGSLTSLRIPFTRVHAAPDPDFPRRVDQFDAVKRWFEDDWLRIEPKLRTSIVEGISVFLSLFDDNPRVKYTFCPPKALYQSPGSPDTSHGIALPPLADMIEQGRVIVLKFPMAMNPGLARALGTMLKQDFQRAMLNRIPKMSADPATHRRPVVFLCDEYQAFATVGENEPSGDEKFFSLARQARCIPIVSTQSISSLRSTLPGESWRTLLQGFRTKVFLTLSDDFSARIAADLCGKAERLKPSYTLTEGGQDAGVSILTGRAGARRSTVSATKSFNLHTEYVFLPKVFGELQNAQAIVLPYDGLNPFPPTFCYLKPHYLAVQTSYFDHVANGAL